MSELSLTKKGGSGGAEHTSASGRISLGSPFSILAIDAAKTYYCMAWQASSGRVATATVSGGAITSYGSNYMAFEISGGMLKIGTGLSSSVPFSAEVFAE